MHDSLLQKVKELSTEARSAIEDLLGRHLEDDEDLSITTYSRQAVPTGEAREVAESRLRKHFAEADSRGTESTQEVEAAISEALGHVRPGYRERR
jgi:hypothetical protein